MAQDIRAAFFDIDGTLTSFTTHTVPQSTIDALHELKRRGVKLFICTGRAPSFISVVLDTLPIEFDGIVGVNGQYITNADGEVVATQPLDEQDLQAIVRWLDEHPDVVASFCEEDFVYFNHSSEQLEASFASLGKTAPERFFGDPHTRSREHTVYQISPYITEEQERDLLAQCAHVEAVRWAPGFADLIYANGGKGYGLRRMMSEHGWDASQAIAFGDGGNDIAMLEAAGIGVAVGNAVQDVQSHANFVTRSVDDHGIAYALEHFGLIGAQAK